MSRSSMQSMSGLMRSMWAPEWSMSSMNFWASSPVWSCSHQPVGHGMWTWMPSTRAGTMGMPGAAACWSSAIMACAICAASSGVYVSGMAVCMACATAAGRTAMTLSRLAARMRSAISSAGDAFSLVDGCAKLFIGAPISSCRECGLLDWRGRLARGLFVVSGRRSRLARGTGAVLLGHDLVDRAAELVGDLLERLGAWLPLAVLDAAERCPADAGEGSEPVHAMTQLNASPTDRASVRLHVGDATPCVASMPSVDTRNTGFVSI